MSTETIKGYVIHQTWQGQTQGEFVFSAHKPITTEHATRLLICEHELTFEVPDDFDPRPAQIAALEQQKQELRAKFAVAVKELDDRINSLLALEMA